MSNEDLRHVFADGVMTKKYLDPSFWLSGAYKDFETGTAKFLSIGPNYIHWVWETTHHKPTELVRELGSLLSVPAGATPYQLYKHAYDRPREMWGQRGVVGQSIRRPPDDPQHLSVAAREEMVEFALTCPFLLDVLKYEAVEDFTLWHAKDSKELLMYHHMPGKHFVRWESEFPWIMRHIYTGIERGTEGEVVAYRIHSVSDEFRELHAMNDV
ncbi:MAG TPA: hypothetical protein VMR81_04745 [Patescibacteria group bacterium]|jgi:hypothetical protein|nr:hypothetical protein [Patescibacteria group bacterium]